MNVLRRATTVASKAFSQAAKKQTKNTAQILIVATHQVRNVHVKTHTSSLPTLLNQYEPSGGRKNASTSIVATVFGCSGFLGRYVVGNLAQTGAQIICPYRWNYEQVRHLRVNGDVGQVLAIRYEPKDYNELFEIVRRSNVVVNCVGRHFKNYYGEDMKNTNIDTVELITKACADAGVERLVHVSAMGAAEDHPSEFYRTKYEGEARVKKIFPDATIMRPAVFFGMEDRLLNFISKCMRIMPGVPYVKRGQALIQPVYVQDVAAAIVAALQDPATIGQTYELAGPDVFKFNQLADIVSSYINEPHTRMPLARPVAMALGYLNEWTWSPTFTRDWVERFSHDNVASGEYMGLEDLGIKPTTVKEMVPQITALWKRGGYFLDVNYKQEQYANDPRQHIINPALDRRRS